MPRTKPSLFASPPRVVSETSTFCRTWARRDTRVATVGIPQRAFIRLDDAAGHLPAPAGAYRVQVQTASQSVLRLAEQRSRLHAGFRIGRFRESLDKCGEPAPVLCRCSVLFPKLE